MLSAIVFVHTSNITNLGAAILTFSHEVGSDTLQWKSVPRRHRSESKVSRATALALPK